MSRNECFLCKIGILSSPACSLCGEADESLEHLFETCHYSLNFGGDVIKWISSLDIQIVILCCKDIIFGITDSKEELFVNHILLIAKKYIYSCKCNKVKPSFLVFLAKVKTIYKLEMMVAKYGNKWPTHLKKWGKFIKVYQNC